MSRLDVEPIHDAARDRMGDVLLALGAKVRGSASRGRASCPVHGGDGMNVAYGNGFATCHSGCGEGKYDALSLVAAVEGFDLGTADGFRSSAFRAAAIFGVRLCEDDDDVKTRVSRPVRARREPPPASPPPFAVEAAWSALPCRDERGEAYLAGRGLLVEPLPDDLVRFNVGSTVDPLAARGRDGFRVVFPARRPDGTVASLSLRRIVPGERWWSPGGFTTKGLGVCREGIALLASGDPDFERDEIVVVEGGTDVLAGTILFDVAAFHGRCPPRWLLGATGAGNAPEMVRAFGSVIKGRKVHVALDADVVGEKRVPAVVAAAREVGARVVTRMRPTGGKDLGEVIRAAREVKS